MEGCNWHLISYHECASVLSSHVILIDYCFGP